MNKNNILEVDDPASIEIMQNLAHPVLRPLYGERESVPPAPSPVAFEPQGRTLLQPGDGLKERRIQQMECQR
jgi:hypothetical protein